MLTRLKDKLAESGYFKNKTVFFDSFRGFTAQEFGIIGKILTQADDVCVALNAPDLTDVGSDDIFYHTKNTAKKLIKIANSVDVPCAKPVTVNEPNSDAALDALAKDFLSPEADVFEGECGSIAVVAAPDIRSECAFIAAQIKKMLRTGEYRSRDIAVIVRDDKSYIRPMMTALAKCGVPVFEDRRQPVINQPLMTLVRAALKIADTGFDTDSVLRALKTGLCPLEADEVSDIENYTYLWQINGSGWLKKWESSPDGFGEMTESASAELERLNALREKRLSRLRGSEASLKITTARAAQRLCLSCCASSTRRRGSRSLRFILRIRARACSRSRRSGSGIPSARCSMSRRRRSAALP